MGTAELNFDTFSALSSIQTTVRALSEQHLERQYTSADCGPTLQDLISSALRDLSQCVNIINSRAPISRLPEDIMGAISHIVNDSETFGASSILRLSHVSRSWHRATQSPLLWASMNIAAFSDQGFARACLQRSERLPIDLKVEIEDDRAMGFAQTEEYAGALCEVLDPHISRCRSIEIEGGELSWLLLGMFHSHFMATDAPLLETFSVRVGGYNWNNPGPEVMFRNAPRLVRVAINHPALEILYPPMGNVKFLRIEYGGKGIAYLSVLLDLLARCPMLETLAVFGGVVPGNRALGRLSLPKLRSLSLHAHYRNSAAFTFLPSIAAPVLSHLIIDGFEAKTFYDPQYHVRMGRLSFPSLTALTLSLACEDAELTETLKMASEHFRRVEKLTINARNLDSRRVLESMTEIQALPAWPCLQWVSLGEIGNLEGCEDALYEFVMVCKKRTPLERLALHSGSVKQLKNLNLLKTKVKVVVFEE